MSLANVLRISLAAQLIGGTLLGVWLLPADAPWWQAVMIGVALPVVGTALVLAIELTVGAIVDPRTPRASPLHVLRVWLGETGARCACSAGASRLPSDFAEPPITHDPQRPALLLIAGYVCNRAVWKPLLESGVLAGCNVATVNLEPVFGAYDDYAQEIDAAIGRLREAQRRPPRDAGVPQHGRAGGTRLPVQARRRCGRAHRHARLAAPRHHFRCARPRPQRAPDDPQLRVPDHDCAAWRRSSGGVASSASPPPTTTWSCRVPARCCRTRSGM
jgi:hypothetical protein